MRPRAIPNAIEHVVAGWRVEMVPLTKLVVSWKLDGMGELLTKVTLSDKLMMQVKDNYNTCCSYLSAATRVQRVLAGVLGLALKTMKARQIGRQLWSWGSYSGLKVCRGWGDATWFGWSLIFLLVRAAC